MLTRRGLPLVATNEPFFATRDDYEAHDALLCIAEGRLVADGERRQLTAEHRFKTRAEMAALFADLPEALAATVEIAERCAFRPRTLAPILPRFSTAKQAKRRRGAKRDASAADEAELRRGARRPGAAAGAARRSRPATPPRSTTSGSPSSSASSRSMKYAGYFLIVADFIQWAKAQGIPVGPGRGSGAGSLVAYSLTITDLDPIRFGLLFERFLNPERISMPDFDIDFCQERRDEVIRYVQEKYGRDRVAQIITFGTLQARGVLRDVGRVLQMPYGQVDKLCKLVPQNPANPITLKRAIDDEPRLQAERDRDPVARRAFDIAQKLEGLHRHASTHAAGIVIGDRPLTELVPLYRDPKSLMPVTQFNMKWVEPAGLVKFDFLGLKTLTVLDRRGQAGAAARHRHRSVATCRSTTPRPTRCWRAARRSACSRWKVQGMRRALIDMRPDRFEDLIVLVALYRPGPMANIPTYCARKLGHETHRLPASQAGADPAGDLRHHHLSGAGPADRARSRRLQPRPRPISCAAPWARKIEGDGVAARRFHLRRGRARHRARRRGGDLRGLRQIRRIRLQQIALGAVRAAHLSDRLHEGELPGRVPGRVDDARDGQHRQARRIPRRGRAARPSRSSRRRSIAPASNSTSTATPSTTRWRRCAASAGRRSRASSRRAASGRSPISPTSPAASIRAPSTSACWRASSPPAPSTRSRPNRARVFAAVDAHACYRAAHPRGRRASASRSCSAARPRPTPIVLPALEAWLPAERLQREYEAVGFFLSGHPLDDYAAALKRLRVQSWAEFSRAVKAGAGAGRVAGTVVARTERRTKTGSKMGIIGLSDPSGHYEAVLFAEGLAQYRDLLEPGTAVLLFLTAEVQGDEVRARIQSVEPLDEAAAKMQKGLRVFLRDEEPIAGVAKRLEPTRLNGGRATVPSRRRRSQRWC